MLTTTYYEVLGDDGKPTARQARLYGTSRYGYKTRVRAELNCPKNMSVCERFTDGANDWAGGIVSCWLSSGELLRIA